jgi:hypothetical protein
MKESSPNNPLTIYSIPQNRDISSILFNKYVIIFKNYIKHTYALVTPCTTTGYIYYKVISLFKQLIDSLEFINRDISPNFCSCYLVNKVHSRSPGPGRKFGVPETVTLLLTTGTVCCNMVR